MNAKAATNRQNIEIFIYTVFQLYEKSTSWSALNFEHIDHAKKANIMLTLTLQIYELLFVYV